MSVTMVTEKYGYGGSVTVPEALDGLMREYSDSGALEQVEADVEAIRKTLVAFMSRYVKDEDDLNDLAGWQKFFRAESEGE